MITLLNSLPVSLNTKMQLFAGSAQAALGSDYNSNTKTQWVGDELTVESLLPQWIIKEYNDSPTTVTIVPIIKNYLRWLLSQEYGYGAQLNWENIRVPLYANSVYLEALAEFCFPGADFASDPLSTILPNIRKFLVKADTNYFNCKGTAPAIKYAICSLMNISWDSVIVTTANATAVNIKLATASATALDNYKSFIEKYITPAGVVVVYNTF